MDMNDAAETLKAYEDARMAKWRADVARRYEASKPSQLGENWKPVFTPEQQAAHNEYVRVHRLPF